MKTEKCLLDLHSELPDSSNFPQKKWNRKVILSKMIEGYSLPGTVTRAEWRQQTQPSHLGKDEQ